MPQVEKENYFPVDFLLVENVNKEWLLLILLHEVLLKRSSKEAELLILHSKYL